MAKDAMGGNGWAEAPDKTITNGLDETTEGSKRRDWEGPTGTEGRQREPGLGQNREG
jgi:hypothetical protein